MKRGLCCGLVALIATGMSLFGAQPARAQGIQCKKVIGTSSWPYNGYTQYCGSALPEDGTNMAGVLYDILRRDGSIGSAANEAGYILSHYQNSLGTGARFWVFGNDNEFLTYCSANPQMFTFSQGKQCRDPNLIKGVSNAAGLTYRPGFTPQWSVIFKSALPNPQTVGSATAHEAGHWLDSSFAWRTLLGSSPGTVFSSDGPKFQLELNRDWYNLNNLSNYSPCDGRAPVRLGTLFRGDQAEPSIFGGNVWICANNGNGPGLAPGLIGNNQYVLETVWPYFFDPTFEPPHTNKEFFAQEVEYVSGKAWGGPASPDNFFINEEFSCTRWLVYSLMVYGQIPGRPSSVIKTWPTGQGCPSI